MKGVRLYFSFSTIIFLLNSAGLCKEKGENDVTFEIRCIENQSEILPFLTDKQKTTLTTIARKTIENYLINKEEKFISFECDGLDYQNEVWVTLWSRGRELWKGEKIFRLKKLGEGWARSNNLAYSTHKATLKILKKVIGEKGYIDPDDLLIEINIRGQEISVNNHNPDMLKQLIELGIHGVRIERGEKTALFLPAVPIRNNWKLIEMLSRLCRKAGLDEYAWRSELTHIYIFKTLDFVESQPGGKAVDLYRGHKYVKRKEITKKYIQDAIIAGADWLARNQVTKIKRKTYIYKYRSTYYPSKDIYSVSGNLVDQSMAAAALAYAGNSLGYKLYIHSAKRAIDYLLKKVKYTKNGEYPYVYYNGEGSLGANAGLLLTIIYLKDEEFINLGVKIANSILYLLNKDGSFKTFYESTTPNKWKNFQDIYPGQALLSLVKFYKIKPQREYLEALEKAYNYYYNYWKNNKNFDFPPWQISAYSEMYRITKEKKYADFVFEMADWMIKSGQQHNEYSIYKDYVGGFGSPPSIKTACLLMGLIDAYDIACILNDKYRMNIYKKCIKMGMHFILNLQYKPEDLYYINIKNTKRSKNIWDYPWRSTPYSRTKGGFRFSLYSNMLRIDSTYYALFTLTKALQYIDEW